MTNDDWLTVTEAIAKFGKSERTIRRWAADGTLESKKVDNRLYVREPVKQQAESDRRHQASPVFELQAEVDRLTSLNDQLISERDYLRQALAAAMSNEQKLIEATTEQKKKSWWEFWR